MRFFCFFVFLRHGVLHISVYHLPSFANHLKCNPLSDFVSFIINTTKKIKEESKENERMLHINFYYIHILILN